jgi:hypothetical protein
MTENNNQLSTNLIISGLLLSTGLGGYGDGRGVGLDGVRFRVGCPRWRVFRGKIHVGARYRPT